MAHDPSKTEKATPKRRGEARKKGQVAKSPEINQTAVFVGGLVGLSPGALLPKVCGMIVSIAFRAAVPLILIAIADFVLARRRFEKSLMMTKDEVKREAREADVPPEVKGKVRQKQAEQARK